MHDELEASASSQPGLILKLTHAGDYDETHQVLKYAALATNINLTTGAAAENPTQAVMRWVRTHIHIQQALPATNSGEQCVFAWILSTHANQIHGYMEIEAK
jgi:hypothetical protein